MIEGNNIKTDSFRVNFPEILNSKKKLYIYGHILRPNENDGTTFSEDIINNINIFKEYDKLIYDNGLEAAPLNLIDNTINLLKENGVDVLYIDSGLDCNFKNHIVYDPGLIHNFSPNQLVSIKDRNILYLSLARTMRFPRLAFTYELYKNELLSDGIVTCGSCDDCGNSDLEVFPDEFQKIIPLYYDGPADRSMCSQTYLLFGRECLINVVHETSYEFVPSKLYPSVWLNSELGYDRPFFTEKTAKAFNALQIPLFLSVAGYVNLLRIMGFDLFEDIINHSYDQADPDERIIMLANELLRLKKIGLETLKSTYGLKDRLLYNKNHMGEIQKEMIYRYKQEINSWFFNT